MLAYARVELGERREDGEGGGRRGGGAAVWENILKDGHLQKNTHGAYPQLVSKQLKIMIHV